MRTADVVTWFLVLLGWLFVNHTNNRREARKEARAAIDAAKKEVIALAELSSSYFSDVSLQTSERIKNSLELLEVELERLDGYSDSNLAIRFDEFHEACTGSDFEASKRTAHGPTSAALLNIAFTRNRLVHQLEIHFRQKYSRGPVLLK